MRINLYCDHTIDEPSYKIDERTAIKDSCIIQVNMKTKYGCAASSFGLMWEFIDMYYIFFGVYIFFTGSYYVLYSIEYFKVTSAICLIQSIMFACFWLLFSFIIKQDYNKI